MAELILQIKNTIYILKDILILAIYASMILVSDVVNIFQKKTFRPWKIVD